MKKSSAVLAAGSVWIMILTSSPGLAGDDETLRSTQYAGVGWFEHGLDEELPYGMAVAPCDDRPLLLDDETTDTLNQTTDDPLTDPLTDPLENTTNGTTNETLMEDDQWEEPIIGIGAGAFCNIPQQNQIHVQVDDHLLPTVTATLSCYRPGTLNFWSWAIFENELHTTIPTWCGQHPNDDPDTTRLLVYLNGPPEGIGASAGEITLTY